jgi:hypothetical protein
VLWKTAQFAVEANAEEGIFLENLLGKFLAGHLKKDGWLQG